jgi:hypothetical protein
VAGVSVARRYVMTRVTAGDYLLPSNDGTVLWRLTRITLHRDPLEDGWYVRRFNGWLPADGPAPPDLLEPHMWETWDGPYDRRSEAVRAALRR